MSLLDAFPEITKADEPLAPLTWLKVGGSAQFLVRPRNADELLAVVQHCHTEQMPVRLLGGGSNLLVRDDGIPGAVLKLDHEEFAHISVDGTVVRSGGGAPLSNLISQSVQAGLAGLENLTGIPGTVGGALHGNSGSRHGDIGQFVKSVTVVTANGKRLTQQAEELSFEYRYSSVNALVILEAEFQLQEDDPDEITRRLRKLWVMKKASQPLTFQSAGCIFKNPRGLHAGKLIEEAGLKGTRIGNAEISDRHANFIITHKEATANEVLQLIELARTKVAEELGVDLETEIEIW